MIKRRSFLKGLLLCAAVPAVFVKRMASGEPVRKAFKGSVHPLLRKYRMPMYDEEKIADTSGITITLFSRPLAERT